MRKLLFSVLFLMIPLSGWAWTTTNDFNTPTTEDGWYIWQSGYGGKASITDTQYAPNNPSKSLQFMSPVEFPDSGVVGGASFAFPSSTKEFWMQYYFKYSDNFQFHTVANKQIYVWDTAGASVGVIDGSVFNNNKINPIFKHEHFRPNTGYDPTIKGGQWYKIVFRVKMVSPGNDIFQMWINDTLASNYQSATLFTNYAASLNKVSIDPVWGGQDPNKTKKAATDYQWYDHVIVSTGPILVSKVIDGGGGTVKQPSIPRLVTIK